MPNTIHDPTVVEATMITRVVKFLDRHGIPSAPILQQAGITPEELDDPERLWPFGQAMRVYQSAADALHDPAFGLAIATTAEPTDYGLIGLIWAHQATLDDALDQLSHFYNAFLESCWITVLRPQGQTRVVTRFDHQHPGLDSFRIELLAAIYLNAQRASRRSWAPLAVTLAMPPTCPDRLREVFGVEVQFNADEDALVLDPELLAAPKEDADATLRAHLLEAAHTHLARRRQASEAQSRLLHLQGCVVDLRTGTVNKGDQVSTLTSKERAILEYLASRPNQTVTHEDLERDIWGIGKTVITHAPAVAIRRLRQKIEPKGRKPINLQTVFGEGWRLVMPVDGSA